MSSSLDAATDLPPAATRTGAGGDSYRDVGVFLAIVFALPWLLWVVEQITGVRILFFAAMMSVAVATFVAVRWVRRPSSIPRATALVPVRPVGRLLRYCLLAFGIFLVASALAVALNAVTGIYPADLTGFSALRDVYAPETAGQTGFPWAIAAGALAANLVQFVLILPLAFCEEWGWRGYLLNRLRDRIGTWPALITIGLICGVWHLPFWVGPWFSMNAAQRQTVIPFTIFCVFFGVLLGLLRLASGSIWPAVVGHAVNNTVVFGFIQVVVADKDAQPSINAWLTGLSGWQGWLILLTAIGILAAAGVVRRSDRDRLPPVVRQS
ncbi:membrane protease YdiL (CAAX protease family) [Allocatelliglobosispora scoriae]|uniref:Membrane protease YdiL (CAAX protease family) n=1 Tax=Allocatelliglobosispora scoriae TaxID=643052 RepID=A0A841BLQ2_9ACTN|nr:type II CAAX endopeptidase family protein [Allocatelliglobosispora scoriae]MBB5867791.1 membrane protease YdiL (CAAX protease family) [Allocatelliglobosispora scoriae]